MNNKLVVKLIGYLRRRHWDEVRGDWADEETAALARSLSAVYRQLETEERAAGMYEYRYNAIRRYSYGEIGKLYGISAARVQQIVARERQRRLMRRIECPCCAVAACDGISLTDSELQERLWDRNCAAASVK